MNQLKKKKTNNGNSVFENNEAFILDFAEIASENNKKFLNEYKNPNKSGTNENLAELFADLLKKKVNFKEILETKEKDTKIIEECNININSKNNNNNNNSLAITNCGATDSGKTEKVAINDKTKFKEYNNNKMDSKNKNLLKFLAESEKEDSILNEFSKTERKQTVNNSVFKNDVTTVSVLPETVEKKDENFCKEYVNNYKRTKIDNLIRYLAKYVKKDSGLNKLYETEDEKTVTNPDLKNCGVTGSSKTEKRSQK